MIEKQVGDYTITIGIECQGRGRVANVEWVEQMITKHQTLPTNKLILVSQSSFTETARKKARAYGIETMTLDRAIQTNWNELVDEAKLVFEKWGIEPSACFAVLAQHDDIMNTRELDFEHQLYLGEEQELFTVKDVIDIFMGMNAEQIILEVVGLDYKNRTPDIHFEIRFSLPVSTYIMDIPGKKQEIREFILLRHCILETELINMQIGSFGTAQIAYGKTETIDKKSLVTIVEHEDKPNTAAIMLPTKDKGVTRIVDLREVKE